MSKILKAAEIAYLAVSIVLYAGMTYVWNVFYQRRLNTDDNFFNPSIIERTKVSVYENGFIVLGALLLVLILILVGQLRGLLVAKIFFVIAFIVQAAGIALVGFALKDIEGPYFWKSPYTEKYFYLVGLIGFLSLWVMVKWVVLLVNKSKS